jgi:hypothetical protein
VQDLSTRANKAISTATAERATLAGNKHNEESWLAGPMAEQLRAVGRASPQAGYDRKGRLTL